MTMRSSLKPLAVAAIAALSAAGASAQQITVTSWGGAYGKSQVEVMHKPFTAKTGVKVLSEDYNGGLAEIQAQVKTGNIKWDVVDVELAEALRGCDEGLFEKIDASKLPKGDDGSDAKADFLPGMVNACAIANISYANVVAYDKAKMGANAPTKLEDFFDLKKFPGKRGMKKEAGVNLEWALMADGVPAADVYKVLSTPAGVDRAFKKLDTIKPQIVWWSAGAQPPQLLASGEVAMTSVYHGRIYDANVKDGKNFAVLWDGQITVPDLFAVVKGSKNTKAAMDFVMFATSTKPLAEQTKFIPYAPARKSSLALVDDKIKPWLPGASHPGRAFQTNAGWWADHADELNQKFAAWLAK
ncbi:ABC transporter substrate-binding protein [Amphibiibacter pelophylacis]|uniref:ABC transporter substrate-binding protein n=1 Tax=Amphibiibacter pelophylacis TaxID=1799477 RepID=A0ACC6P533_9BURK